MHNMGEVDCGWRRGVDGEWARMARKAQDNLV